MNKMTNNQIILEQIINERWEESGEGLTKSEYFEMYSATEILKNYEVTNDDVKYGIVGNGGDGGIDSIYTFVNGEPLKEDTTINPSQKSNHIELIIIQSKISASFKEGAVGKFRESAEDLFNLANNPDDYLARYNSDLIDKAKLFRESYKKLARTFPKVQIRYFYATQGDEVHPNVSGKVKKLRDDILKMFSGAEFNFEFIGASKLLEMTRNIASSSRVLELAESPIGTSTGSYICLVTLSKYFEFISDSGTLVRSIFESNVRDFQGDVVVNTGIRKTLENKESENFWYLNNGVTIITPKAVMAGKQLTIEDPQIVNGLQTSYEIHGHFSKLQKNEGDDREILIRVICEKDDGSRDRIIRATNSQTAIPPASLRSSDEIHRNIEDFLKTNGFYYDRKKNSYKNQGMPSSKIISISYMAQSMMAIILQKPDFARARPSTLINSDADYKKIFSLDTPINIYLKAVQIMKAVEFFLRPEICGQELERKTITNVKFYVAMVASIKLIESKNDVERKLAHLPNVELSSKILTDSLAWVLLEFEKMSSTDQAAKGSVLVSRFLQ